MEKNQKKEKTQPLPENIYSNPCFLEELETLFDLAPPSSLKKSITDLFFSYFCNTEVEDYKPEIKDISVSIYLLVQF